ncbi:hypothetical protein O9G_001817 [Rozella allomycis CSF55]|uniref:Uncharacterized protein n=1 Tax=Rozella allomycis (strain CSF55) TaxID=988480 RepID=A0A075B158_ROZAC|nr:hypothetical protein O9G_001817 [Rozella allomycis CSF55]|eukprot:EPZ34561.1 hypothetical protein O9G_001817 [Rozella allomycis CSF55]
MRQRPLDAESFIEKTLENTIVDMFRNAFWLKSSADLFNTSDEYQLLSSLFAKYNDLKQQIMQIGNYNHEFTANFKIGEKCSKQITDLLTNDNIDRNDLLNMRFFCEIAAILHSLDRNKDFLIVATEMRGDADGKVNVVATGFRSFGDVVNDLGKSASNVRKDAYMQIELNDYREMVDELKAFVISNKKLALGNSVEQHFRNKQIVFSLIADFAKEFIEKFDFEGI